MNASEVTLPSMIGRNYRLGGWKQLENPIGQLVSMTPRSASPPTWFALFRSRGAEFQN
jgi:hypothetical protein